MSTHATIAAMPLEELLHLAAKAMHISWPQNKVSENAKVWNPAENSSDCFEMAFTLGLIADPMGFESIAAWRYSLLLRAAYLGSRL